MHMFFRKNLAFAIGIAFLGFHANAQQDRTNRGRLISPEERVFSTIKVVEPSQDFPVSMNAAIYSGSLEMDQEIEVVIKVQIHKDWHIYAYVPESGMFYETVLDVELPEGLKAVGDLLTPATEIYLDDPEIMLYKGELMFTQKLKVSKNYDTGKAIKINLEYSACNAYTCKPIEVLEKKLVI